MITITALMDDHLSNSSCVSEHGLSYLVQTPTAAYLFDCGQSPGTWRNARALNRDIYNVDGVILSHSHYDHAGGYPALVEGVNGGSLLYTGPDFWEEKYSFDGKDYHSRSAGFGPDFLTANGITHQVVTGLTEISPGIWLVGNFPRVHDFETIPEKFVRKTEDGFVPDDFHDEICMAIDLGGKLAVLVGCSHPGILNMLDRIHEALKLPIYAVFGGAHLLEAEEPRITATLSALKDMGTALLGLGHCSGSALEAAIARDPSFKGCHLGAGDSITI